MATSKEKREETRFRFDSGEELSLSRWGKFECAICSNHFVVPGVDIMLHYFTICPSCILSGPAAVAAEAKRFAADKDRIKRIHKYDDSPMGRRDAADMAWAFRDLALRLRGIGSFEEIPGGAVAVAIAGVKLEKKAGKMTRTKISEFIKSDTL